MREKRICPECGQEYTAPPATSRKDNKTEICPECGTREALKAARIDEKTAAAIMQAIKEAQLTAAKEREIEISF